MTATELMKKKEQIYLDFSDKVSGYIHSRINNPLDAEDLHSVVFLKVYQNLEQYSPDKASLSTWIYVITRNAVIDYYRKKRITYPMENLPEPIAEDMVDDALLTEESLEELAIALEQLDPRERDIIILHYYTGITLKETAEKMGMSYSNMKIVHKKALEHLKKLLP